MFLRTVCSFAAKHESVVTHATPLRSLTRILSPEKFHLAGAAVALTATSGGTLAFPYFTGKLMDGFAQSTQNPEVWIELVNTNAAACLGALAIIGLGGFSRAYLLETASEKIARRLRMQLFESLLSKPQSFYDSARTGDLVSRLGSDVTRVSKSVMDAAFGFRVLLNGAAGTALVSQLVPLTLLPQLLAPVALMFLGGVAYGRFVRKIATRQNEALSKSMQIAEENLSLIRIVKLFNGEERGKHEYTKSLNSVYALAQSNALATGGRVTAFVTIGGGFILHTIYNCGMLIAGGTLTLGQTSALAGYLLVCGNSYQGLVTAYGDIQKALGACDRVVQLMDPTRSNEGIEASPSAATGQLVRPVVFSSSAPSVKFENVSFAYSADSSKFVLNDLNLFVPSGAKHAIVGPSGCGKSSILQLVSKLYNPVSGRVLLNDVDMTQVDTSYLRESVLAVVPQETSLFNDTIRNNIMYPREGRGDDEPSKLQMIKEYARLNFVTDWNATVGERGQNLSGGERQRIAIARALSRNAPLLLLDEATSALDRESDSIVLNHLSGDSRTVIAVTHRMSAIEWSDRLTVIAEGRAVQEGDTQQLLKDPGPVLQKLLAQIESTKQT